ncbi:MAG: hypothetical protein ACYSTR_08210 [Planctomycetota bacterium]|jgi:hypothetical protein
MRRRNTKLVEAIKRMEAADDWPIVLLLLELAQFRSQAPRKSATDAVPEEKVTA